MLDINLLIHILNKKGSQKTMTPCMLIEILQEYKKLTEALNQNKQQKS